MASKDKEPQIEEQVAPQPEPIEEKPVHCMRWIDKTTAQMSSDTSKLPVSEEEQENLPQGHVRLDRSTVVPVT